MLDEAQLGGLYWWPFSFGDHLVFVTDIRGRRGEMLVYAQRITGEHEGFGYEVAWEIGYFKQRAQLTKVTDDNEKVSTSSR